MMSYFLGAPATASLFTKSSTGMQYKGIIFDSRTSFANKIFFITGGFSAKVPFNSSGKTCATSATESGIYHSIDDLLGVYLMESADSGNISACHDCIFNFFRVDSATIPENKFFLGLVEIRFFSYWLSKTILDS